MVTYMGHENYCGPNKHIYNLRYVTRKNRRLYQCEICKWMTDDPNRDEKKMYDEMVKEKKNLACRLGLHNWDCRIIYLKRCDKCGKEKWCPPK